MKTSQMLLVAVPVALLASGFTIGGRDGAIISIVGAAILLLVSFWQAIKIVGKP